MQLKGTIKKGNIKRSAFSKLLPDPILLQITRNEYSLKILVFLKNIGGTGE